MFNLTISLEMTKSVFDDTIDIKVYNKKTDVSFSTRYNYLHITYPSSGTWLFKS